MNWIINSTDGFSYSIPMIDEYTSNNRMIVTGFVAMCSWYNGETEIEVPDECPQISSGGCGLMSVDNE